HLKRNLFPRRLLWPPEYFAKPHFLVAKYSVLGKVLARALHHPGNISVRASVLGKQISLQTTESHTRTRPAKTQGVLPHSAKCLLWRSQPRHLRKKITNSRLDGFRCDRATPSRRARELLDQFLVELSFVGMAGFVGGTRTNPDQFRWKRFEGCQIQVGTLRR